MRASSRQAGFPIMGPFPPIKIFPLPMKVLVPPIITWNGTQNELVLKLTLRKVSACGVYFYKNLQFKNFYSPPFNRISRGMSTSYWTNPNENPGRSRKEPWLGFRRRNPFFFFFCFLMSLKQLNGLQYYKKTYSWFKKLSQFKTYLFFLANNPAHGWILYYVEKNLTPICLCSWLTGIIEKWISLQYYNGMKVYFYKARKFSNSEIHEVFSKLHLLAEQG